MHRGSLDDLESLRSGATAADGVIHAAYIQDFSKYKENSEIDRRAIEALDSALVGSDRSLIFTSVTALVGQGRVATEDMPVANASSLPRASSEEAAGSAAMREVRVSVIRLPPSVHGDGDSRFGPGSHQHSVRKERLSLHRRRAQPLACCAQARCGTSVQTCFGKECGQSLLPWRR